MPTAKLSNRNKKNSNNQSFNNGQHSLNNGTYILALSLNSFLFSKLRRDGTTNGFDIQIQLTIDMFLHSGTNKTTEFAKGLSSSTAVQNQLLPTSSQQIQSHLLHTEDDQDKEGDLTIKMMTTSGTISVSRIQLRD